MFHFFFSSPMIFCFFVFVFFSFYLFIHRYRERERQRHRQREKQASYREPDVGLNPGSPGSRPGLQVVLNHCATGAALLLVSMWCQKPRGRSRLLAGSPTWDSIPGLQDHALGCRWRQTAVPPGLPPSLSLNKALWMRRTHYAPGTGPGWDISKDKAASAGTELSNY